MNQIKLSFTELQQELKHVTLRFPLALVICVIAFVTSVLIIDRLHRADYFLLKVILICGIALPGLITLTILPESFKWNTTLKYSIQVLLLILLAVYYYTLPENMDKGPMIHVYRYIGLLFAAHLSVAVSVIGYRNRQFAFWYFNQYVFFRWLQASLFSAVLFVGLSGAIMAMDSLFNLTIDAKAYGYLFALISCIFHPMYFLAGLPQMRLREDDEHINFSPLLKIFSIYILIPIVLIYLSILYLYGAKILLTWSWPKGWVSWLVLGFSVSGVLSWLLIYPLQQSDKQNLAKLYYRYYFIALMPVLLLLYLAIFKRINMYSFTEDRYIILITAIWLTIVSLHSIVRKGNLIFIPLSLLIATMISIYGPISMFSISKKTQYSRLVEILEEHNLLDGEGKINNKQDKMPEQLNSEEQFEVTSILNYLIKMHGLTSVQPLLAESVDSLKTKYARAQAEDVMNMMGIKPKYTKDDIELSTKKYEPFLYVCAPKAQETNGYTYVVPLEQIYNISNETTGLKEMDKLGKYLIVTDAIKDTIDLNQWLDNKLTIGHDMQLPVDEMTVKVDSLKHYKLILLDISGESRDNENHIYKLSALLLFNK